MARYPHFIKPAKPGKWPDCVICVDCRTVVESVDETEKRQVERLTGWNADILVLKAEKYIRACEAGGVSVADWWRQVEHQCKFSRNVWIISYQCGRIWSLLGFWDQLETGNVGIVSRSLGGENGHTVWLRKLRKEASNPLGPMSAGALSRLLAKDGGTLVCDDPPNIAVFTLGDRGHKISWVDWRNYGCGPMEPVLQGAGSASEIARWWADYAIVLRRLNLGSPRTTAGSQAFHGWRTGYYRGGVHVHTHRDALATESRSYHGGRCECFRIGAIQGTVFHIDVRSLYPSICAGTALPVRLISIRSRGGSDRGSGYVGAQGRIAEVFVDSNEPAYPTLRDGLTIWPVGRYRTTLAGPELEDAERHGRVVEYYSVAYYDMVPCLKDYAEAVYALRCESEQKGSCSLSQTAKKLLVSLPGKFAQRLRVWETIPFTGPHPLWGEWWGADNTGQPIRYRGVGKSVQVDRDLGYGGETVPSIAAWITSAGRMVLLAAIRMAGWDEVCYCDTDSLIVSERGYLRLSEAGLIANRELGKWQLKEVIHDAQIHGIKYYIGNGTVVCSGLPKGSITRSSDPTRYWYTDSPSWQIQTRHKPTAARRLLTYQRTQEYRHGIVDSDGLVKPIRLEEK